METELLWKPDWAQARQAFVNWWERKGLALAVYAPRNKPHEKLPQPPADYDLKQRWFDLDYWVEASLAGMAGTFTGGVAFPSFNTNIGGPGSLGLFLGAKGVPGETTLWYEPCIHDPEQHPPLRFDPSNWWWQHHLTLLREALRLAHGRYLVGLPDLIENIDTLAQVRDPQTLLMDMVERPAWVTAKLEEINRAFFESYDELWKLLRDPWGGVVFNAFSLWAPGKVAKVQCDFSCMISAEMFRKFVVPPLQAQCEWLDYSMYHLDGTQARHHLPALLEIEALDAIEWTPQAGLPGGGSPQWYDIYREIKAAGKSVQAIGVKPAEVEPLIDAVGPEGMYIMCGAKNETEARSLLDKVGWKG
jgi:hypothetical protein